MKWDSAWKVLQISDYEGETAKPKPFIKGMLETINQSYFYLYRVSNCKEFLAKPSETTVCIGDATGVLI